MSSRPYLDGVGDAEPDVVTGDAVALDLPAASLPLRMVSALVDVAVLLALLVVMAVVAALASVRLDSALAAASSILLSALVLVGVPTTVETLTRGRSLGKRIVGLRVVRDDGGTVSFQHAFVRALLGVVEIFALSGTPAAFASLLDRRGKRLGDHAAGTYVVRDRVTWQPRPPLPMPPELEPWARGVDLRPLPPELARAMRQYVERGASLRPEAADALGRRLLDELPRHVAPPPPVGAPVDRVLAAVLAERHRRDAARLAGLEATRRRLTTRGTG